jgi:predicted peroxiredoxin
MLDLLSPLGFSKAAATSGMEVYLYVQGTAVHVLKKGYRGYLPGWQRPFSFFARRGLEATGHDQATVKFSKVQKLGKHIKQMQDASVCLYP